MKEGTWTVYKISTLYFTNIKKYLLMTKILTIWILFYCILRYANPVCLYIAITHLQQYLPHDNRSVHNTPTQDTSVNTIGCVYNIKIHGYPFEILTWLYSILILVKPFCRTWLFGLNTLIPEVFMHTATYKVNSSTSLILVEDIPMCLSVILTWNKIYTSSNTTILYFIHLKMYY